jgi:hypothetical protein
LAGGEELPLLADPEQVERGLVGLTPERDLRIRALTRACESIGEVSDEDFPRLVEEFIDLGALALAARSSTADTVAAIDEDAVRAALEVIRQTRASPSVGDDR